MQTPVDNGQLFALDQNKAAIQLRNICPRYVQDVLNALNSQDHELIELVRKKSKAQYLRVCSCILGNPRDKIKFIHH